MPAINAQAAYLPGFLGGEPQASRKRVPLALMSILRTLIVYPVKVEELTWGASGRRAVEKLA